MWAKTEEAIILQIFSMAFARAMRSAVQQSSGHPSSSDSSDRGDEASLVGPGLKGTQPLADSNCNGQKKREEVFLSGFLGDVPDKQPKSMYGGGWCCRRLLLPSRELLSFPLVKFHVVGLEQGLQLSKLGFLFMC